MEKFIDFIIELANDELYGYIDGDAKRFFLSGGCYELAKILKKYVNECKIVINEDKNHCGVLYMRKVYDATGIVKDSSKFKIANQNDINYMEDFFGIPEKKYVGIGENRKIISDFLIDEIAKCNINCILKEFNGDER